MKGPSKKQLMKLIFMCCRKVVKRCQTDLLKFSKCGSDNRSFDNTWIFVRNREFWVPPQTCWIRICIFKNLRYSWFIVLSQFQVYSEVCRNADSAFNKILRWFVSTVEIQKHCLKVCSFWPESLGKNNSNNPLIFQSLIKLWFSPHSSYSLPYYFSNLIFLLPNSHNCGIGL